MASKNKIQKIVIVLIVLGVLMAVFTRVGCNWYGRWVHTVGKILLEVRDVDRIMTRFIEETGSFPKSEEELVDYKLIKRIKTDGGYEYFLRLGITEFGEEKAYFKCPDFKLFRIAYGANIEDIKVVGVKLYDKSTNEQILLIDGFYKEDRFFRKNKYRYEAISLKWYNLLQIHSPFTIHY